MEYKIPEGTPIAKTFSLRKQQIVRLIELSEKMAIDQSTVVRQAVDDYYLKISKAEKAKAI